MKIKVEAIQCKDCGRVGLSVEDIRVTSHKCSGAWKVIAEASVDLDENGKPVR